jgi:hypothetical protein
MKGKDVFSEEHLQMGQQPYEEGMSLGEEIPDSDLGFQL